MEKNSYPEITTRVRCLECGDKIVHYRTNKKFCCSKCRDTYFNRKKRQDARFRHMIDSQLERNYKILTSLLLRDEFSANIEDLTAMGFRVGSVTSFTRTRNYVSYACFDISFRISDTRIFNIRRMSLTLP